MPLYDRQCACGWREIDRWETVTCDAVPCPSCGAATERAWLTRASTVIGDEIDFVQHNGTKDPIRFRSRAAFKHWLKEHGYHIRDSHIPEAGSDKSKFTTNWAASYDPYTAENVRILLERQFTAGSKPEEPPITWNIHWSTGTATKEMVEKYAGK